MRAPLALVSIVLLLATASGQQPGPTTLEVEPSCVPGECPPGDNDPSISQDEVVAPPVESEDGWGDSPPSEWHEDPDSVNGTAQQEAAWTADAEAS